MFVLKFAYFIVASSRLVPLLEEEQRDAGVSGFKFLFEVSAPSSCSSLAEASRRTHVAARPPRTTDGFDTNPTGTDILSTVCFKTLSCLGKKVKKILCSFNSKRNRFVGCKLTFIQ